eukprot:TRINITY_DN3722_c0_g1_i1.p1 TRINITY_DN3722_c0_g1~~TRINITY_DN3722_c0_g1_i1.p1  ORF type:complete len:114 (+),score=4.56 TRINITY_DN3722_c0_g1_i1:192-533(+)
METRGIPVNERPPVLLLALSHTHAFFRGHKLRNENYQKATHTLEHNTNDAEKPRSFSLLPILDAASDRVSCGLRTHCCAITCSTASMSASVAVALRHTSFIPGAEGRGFKPRS